MIKEIRFNIKVAKLKSAFINLNSLIVQKNISDEKILASVLLLESRYNYLRNQVKNGIISSSNQELLQNKITLDLVKLVDDLEIEMSKIDNEINIKQVSLNKIFSKEKRWDNYPLVKLIMVYLGWLKIHDISDYNHYAISRFIELKKIKSFPRIIQFFEIEQEKARRETSNKRVLMHSIIEDVLYWFIKDKNFENTFTQYEKNSLYIFLMNTKLEIKRLKVKNSEKEAELQEEKDFQRLADSIGYRIKNNEFVLPSTIFQISTDAAYHLLMGYLSYANKGFSSMSWPLKYKNKCDWVNFGDELLSLIRSPMDGFIINEYYGSSKLQILSSEDYAPKRNIGYLMYGELIEECHRKIKKGFNPQKIDLNIYKKELEVLRELKYEILEIDEKHLQLFEFIERKQQ